MTRSNQSSCLTSGKKVEAATALTSTIHELNEKERTNTKVSCTIYKKNLVCQLVSPQRKTWD